MDYGDISPVYLVMGTDTTCKTNVSHTLAVGLGATHMQTSTAGVRSFRRRPDSAYPIVVDTLPFKSTYPKDSGWLRLARKWISMNSLRRMFGRKVILVAVVNSSTPADFIDGHDKYTPYSVVNWLPLLAYIWSEYKEAKLVLVKSESSGECQEKAERWRDELVNEGFDPANIILARLSRRGLPVADFRISDNRPYTRPFLLKEVTRHDSHAHSFGPWGPESVILFGRTGSGKSTLAQMLISGRLNGHHDRNPFSISSGIRGATKRVERGEGRGWYVVDTPGFGEPKDELSTTSTALAERRIKQYVQIIEGTYSHFLYVVKKDRIDKLEERLWKFFCLLFGEDLMFFFTVVVSGADEGWLADNRAYLETVFEGCPSFVAAEFPFVKTDDEEWEAENRTTRATSLKALEDELASRERYDVVCVYGRFSSITATGEIASITGRAVRSLSKKVTNKFRAAFTWAYADFRRLMKLLMRDDKVVLCPVFDDDQMAELLQHPQHSPQ